MSDNLPLAEPPDPPVGDELEARITALEERMDRIHPNDGGFIPAGEGTDE